MKQLFLKAREEGKDQADALHAYSSTPLDSKTPSPMAILMGRLPCTNLPMSHAVKAKVGHLSPPETVRAKSKVNDVKHHELHLNQPIMHQDVKDKQWVPSQSCATVSPAEILHHQNRHWSQNAKNSADAQTVQAENKH